VLLPKLQVGLHQVRERRQDGRNLAAGSWRPSWGGFRFYLFYLKLCQTMNIISDSDTLKILLLQTTSSLNILATGLSGAHAFTFLLVQLLLLYF
jgi:hypothetical protein